MRDHLDLKNPKRVLGGFEESLTNVLTWAMVMLTMGWQPCECVAGAETVVVDGEDVVWVVSEIDCVEARVLQWVRVKWENWPDLDLCQLRMVQQHCVQCE